MTKPFSYDQQVFSTVPIVSAMGGVVVPTKTLGKVVQVASRNVTPRVNNLSGVEWSITVQFENGQRIAVGPEVLVGAKDRVVTALTA